MHALWFHRAAPQACNTHIYNAERARTRTHTLHIEHAESTTLHARPMRTYLPIT